MNNSLEDELRRAESIDPGNPFVAGLRKFYTERGFLSAKQVAALQNVTPTRRPEPQTTVKFGRITADDVYAEQTANQVSRRLLSKVSDFNVLVNRTPHGAREKLDILQGMALGTIRVTEAELCAHLEREERELEERWEADWLESHSYYDKPFDL